jgi:hypothetical protein
MSQETVEKVLGRLLTDEAFRSQAVDSLEKVCIKHGYQLSAEELRIISRLDIRQMSIAAEAIDGDIRRSTS